jgi:hypothetical protein
MSRKKKAIPDRVKLEVVLAQAGKCKECGERLGALPGIRFDHRPPWELRPWCEETQDTDPPANSVAHMEAVHANCHDVRTFGEVKGEKNKAPGDLSLIAKARRIDKVQEFHRRIMAEKAGVEVDEIAPKQRRKRPIPSRPFPKRQKAV